MPAVLLLLLLFLGGCFGSNFQIDPYEPFKADNETLTKLPDKTEGSVHFLVLGDWGRRGGYYQDEVAASMGRAAEQVGAQFVLTVGDNFYPDGVDDLSDSHWRDSFENVYTASSLDIPWYVSLGNHDWRGSTNAQKQYTAVSDRWTMPYDYYSFVQEIDDSTSVRFIVLDTLPIYRLKFQRVRGERSGYRRDANRQLNWLRETLENSESQWNIVVGHHPLYSSGHHGEEVEVFRRELLPILRKYDVQAYFAGHDHHLEHLKTDSLDLFISGGGSLLKELDEDLDDRDPRSIYSIVRPGFAVVSMSPNQMLVQFVGHEDNVLYGTLILRDSEVLIKEEEVTEPEPAVPVETH